MVGLSYIDKCSLNLCGLYDNHDKRLEIFGKTARNESEGSICYFSLDINS